MLQPIYAIAKATFHEAWRRRFLNGILVFAILMIGSSRVLMYMQPGAELNMLRDIGMGSIRFFGLLISVFVGARLISDEVEKRTIYTILARPVTRAQFLIGKFAGGVATVWSNIAIMSAVFFVLFALSAPRVIAQAAQANQLMTMQFVYANVAKALLLTFFEMFVVMALAVTASTIFSWIVATIFTFFIYFVGQMSEWIHQLADPSSGASKLAVILMGTFYRIIPHFEIFDVRESILTQQPIFWEHMGKVIGQASLYVLIIMLIGYLFFNEREV